MVNGKQLNAEFVSTEEFNGEDVVKNRIRERAAMAVQEYLNEARNVPRTGIPESLAIWPEFMPVKGVIQPLDAFELKDLPK